MKRLLIFLLLATAQAHAALSLNTSNTTGVQTFGTTPPETDWSTVSMAGAAATLASVSAVETAAQALIATNITTVLGTQAGNATNALAQRNSVSNFIYTAPTGNNATALMATLQNDSGAPVTAITIGYNHTRIGTAAEESMGHRVFYSLTGLANSWTLIPGLSGIGTNQALSVTISLSAAWTTTGKLYLLWVDDNGSGTDTPFTIDDFVVTATNPPPVVSLTSPASGAVATAPGSFALSAAASDDGSVTQVEFLRNGSVIHTDNTAPFEHTDSGLTAGAYSYTARATDNLGSTATSAAVPVSVVIDPTQTALLFDGVNDYVTMGAAPELGVGGPPGNGMTLECWFRKDGAGVTSNSGSGGVTAVPLFGKGRGEGDATNVDCNYFFGINTGGILVADFEAYPASGITSGQNYPITGTNTPITNGIWNHAAVTYDGPSSTWRIYLNGSQVGTSTAPAGALPRYDSIQHFAIGAALNSTGAREGAFAGAIDEVRVWNFARSAADIAQTMNLAIASAPGLVGRFGLNEGTGTTTASSAGVSSGTLTNGPVWIDGAAVVENTAPTVAVTNPLTGSTLTAPAAFTIEANAADADGTVAKVEFLLGGNLLGQDVVVPYTFNVSDLAAGNYAITARATDNYGSQTTSAAVNLTVDPPLTAAPIVSITSPVDGANFIFGVPIPIAASASDSDGTVVKVGFFDGATKLSEDTAEPFEFTWNGAALGSHTLTAVATDNLTATGTSTAVIVTVVPNQAPLISLTSPADNATTAGSVTLEAAVSDLENQPLTVTFYGRNKAPAPGPDFTLVTIPDTQFYSQNTGGTRLANFTSQTNWIVSSKDTLNTAFVAHMGDMVQDGDTNVQQWINADSAMDIIENPLTTLLTYGIPWGGAPGNHDQQPIGSPDGASLYWNTYFGTARWDGRSYWGGNYSTNNDNNYQLFSASGLDFIVVNMEYRPSANQAVLDWADALLKAHPNRRAIVTSHWLISIGNPAAWGGHGQAVYDNLKDNPNLFLMLCGHIHGEGQRADVFEGRTVRTVLQDYQDRANGGDSWLRYFVFSPANNTISAKTLQTTTGTFETDTDSQFSFPYDMGGPGPWTELGTVSASGGTATVNWTGLAAESDYEWYAAVSDGTNSVGSAARSFKTSTNVAPSVTLNTPLDGATIAKPATVEFTVTAADSDGTVAKVEFFNGTTKLGEDTGSPYTFSWNPPSGSYAVSALATDNQGATNVSAVANITVTNPDNIAPTVAITSPLNGATIVAPSGNLAATAADSDGTISKVEFFAGVEKLGEDTTVPFTLTWMNAVPGTYVLTAKATDNDAGVTTSAPVGITVVMPPPFAYIEDFNAMGTAGNSLPSGWDIHGTLGGSNATWDNSTGIPASGTPSAATNGTVNNTLLVTSDAATGTINSNTQAYNAALAGSTTDRTLATAPTSGAGLILQLSLDNTNTVAISQLRIGYDTRRLRDGAGLNQLPGYWLFYSLDNGSTWTNVSALNPSLASGSVQVPNTTGVTSVSDYDLTLASAWQPGSQIRFRWVDDNASESSPDQFIGLDNVSIRVPAPIVGQPPTVALTAPADGSSYGGPATIVLAANASDSDGTITKVEFYSGGTKLGESTTAPYGFSWNGVSAGAYSLTARALDNDGNLSISAPVSVTVTPPPGIASGPWSGNVTHNRATINVTLNSPGISTRAVVSKSIDLSNPIFTNTVTTAAVSGNAVRLDITGLDPLTVYHYAIETNGFLQTSGDLKGKFSTFPVPGAASFRFAFGSCGSYSNTEQHVYEGIVNDNPLFFIHMGDMNYQDINSTNVEDYRTVYNAQITTGQLRRVCRAMGMAYMWDDHDYAGNDSNKNNIGRTATRQVYRERFPHYALPAGGPDAAIYQTFTVGRVKYIITDLRSERDPTGNTDNASKSMMSATQKAWFKQELIDARDAEVPLIVWNSSVPFISSNTGGDDWGRFQTERREILEFIRDEKIQNIVIISGDMHALSLDDGQGTASYVAGVSIPVFHGAALAQSGSTKGGPYRVGANTITPNAGLGRFGIMDVTDNGSNLSAVFRGRITSGSGSTWTSTADWTFTGSQNSFTYNAEPTRPRKALSPTAVAALNAIQLAWQDDSGVETGYRIERRPAGSGSFVTLTTVAANVITYSDTSVIPGAAYDYRIVALNQTIEADPSATATATALTAWQNFKLASLGGPGGSDLDDSGDNDGLALLQEFAFGLNPALRDNLPLVADVPQGQLVKRGIPTLLEPAAGGDGRFRALYIRHKNTAQAGIIYQSQFSGNLDVWGPGVHPSTVIAEDGDYELVSERFPDTVNGDEARFFRIMVMPAQP